MLNWFKKNRAKFTKFITSMMMVITLTLTVGATGSSGGTMASAISDISTSLNGVIGYLTSVTSALLDNDLWLLGMGFFVIMFVAGFVMYLFRVGRR